MTWGDWYTAPSGRWIKKERNNLNFVSWTLFTLFVLYGYARVNGRWHSSMTCVRYIIDKNVANSEKGGKGTPATP